MYAGVPEAVTSSPARTAMPKSASLLRPSSPMSTLPGL
jgi:hypothetical protein